MPGPSLITALRWSKPQHDEYCWLVGVAQHYCDQGLLLMSPFMLLICCSCCGCWARETEERNRGSFCCLVECGNALGQLCWNMCGRCACGVRCRQRCCACCASREERRRTRRQRAARRLPPRHGREADELFGAPQILRPPISEV